MPWLSGPGRERERKAAGHTGQWTDRGGQTDKLKGNEITQGELRRLDRQKKIDGASKTHRPDNWIQRITDSLTDRWPARQVTEEQEEASQPDGLAERQTDRQTAGCGQAAATLLQWQI